MKHAIVVGGTSGIGHGITDKLLENNYKVIVTGTRACVESQIYDFKKSDAVEVECLNCIEDDISKKLETFVNNKLNGSLDLLVYSAGIGNLNKNLGHQVENRANKVNVLGFTEAADWSYRFFEKQAYGHFVGITSLSAVFGSRVAPAYHAAKAYQASYLEGLRQKAHKSKKPIYITDVRPGFVDTPLTKGKKMFWVASQEKAGRQIYSMIKNKRKVGYVSRRWSIIAFIIKALPSFIRNRM
ncbi:Short-chain dehydrogenase [Pustulibacterium marinum]|uniref:Short-chain dehydrogenase n=1 Tax=Pustulibacterium marinum TaxID=1224947 RepID=A0A1I7FT47_9FLAO|nr:SDR family NAD(P)-dependent oxidoreductase [Pustulibacterium marinum]SFU39327.1 Short-chain dehydrogenase [Pustulibacterium marinum]